MSIGQTIYRTRNPMTQMASILRLCFDPVEDALFEAARRLCSESDLLIGHYFMHPLQVAAEQAGRPYVSVMLSHAGIPTAFNHPIGVRGLGKTGNRFLWWLTRAALNKTLKHYPNRLREQLGMLPVQDIVTQVWISPHLTLLAVSPQVSQRQADWPVSVQACGFLNGPVARLDGPLHNDLAAFLDAGDAPIYMSMGSWMPSDVSEQTAMLKLLMQAAGLAQCRAIIQSPTWQECGFTSNRQFLYVASAPHHEVFPHCSAVVHHGGAGTTQSATRAGKPSIVVAHISEQEHWGRELQRIGIAGKPLKRRNLSPEKLARQIRHVQNTPAMIARARPLAELMNREDGVAEAVKLIRAKFGQMPRS